MSMTEAMAEEIDALEATNRESATFLTPTLQRMYEAHVRMMRLILKAGGEVPPAQPSELTHRELIEREKAKGVRLPKPAPEPEPGVRSVRCVGGDADGTYASLGAGVNDGCTIRVGGTLYTVRGDTLVVE